MASESFELNRGESNSFHMTPEEGRRDRNQSLNLNNYASKKSAAESMLDIALLMANASQLNAVIEQGSDFKFYVLLVSLISISLVFQVIVGILLIFSARTNLNNVQKHAKLDTLNNITTGLIFIIVIVNILITAFGVQRPPLPATGSQ